MSEPLNPRVVRRQPAADRTGTDATLRDDEVVSQSVQAEEDADYAPEPFPLDAFPCGPMADMARAICESARVPSSLAGCCVLGAVSASIGPGLQINSLQNCVSRANLALVASAQSGTGKSLAFNFALKPIQDKQAELTLQWRRERLPALRARQDLLEARIKRLKNRAGRPEPEGQATVLSELESAQAEILEVEEGLHPPKLFVEDVTVQALADVFARDPGECTASLSADAGEAINILLGRYNQTKRTDDSLFVKAWTGDPHTVDRKGSSFCLQRPCLTTLWLLQREKLDALLASRGLVDGGFVPRLLICHTDCQPQYVDRNLPGIDPLLTSRYRELIHGLLDAFRSRPTPWTIDPTRDARDALDRHYDVLVDRRRGELQDVSSYAARWNEQAWRIALCLHAAKWGEAAGEHPLELDTASAAIRISDWFARQQIDILSAQRMKAQQDRDETVVGFLIGKPIGCTAREIQRGPLRGLRALDVTELLSRLESEKKIVGVEVPTPGGGHAVRRYRSRAVGAA